MRLGDYDILELLGSGGMGNVYRAVHRTSGDVVAIKLMSSDSSQDPLLLRRFEREYAAASRLEHPHIIRALDFGVDGVKPFLVMELVEGHSLGQIVRNNGPLTEPEAFRIVREVASALQYAHENRLIHRDVKPDNILIDLQGQARLVDLGLVKDLDQSLGLTQLRASLGTITFMAPEQFEGAERVDPRCDVYGLAGTLYYALTGVLPFPGRGNMTVLQKKLRNELDPPSRHLPGLSAEVDALICQALDADPLRRPDTCMAFAAGLIPGTRKASGIDRRIARRYPSLLPARCLDDADRERGRGELLDVSRTGFCLMIHGQVQPNERLRVEVADAERNQTHNWPFVVRWQRTDAPGVCRIGGEFLRELTPEELDLLLGSLPNTENIR